MRAVDMGICLSKREAWETFGSLHNKYCHLISNEAEQKCKIGLEADLAFVTEKFVRIESEACKIYKSILVSRENSIDRMMFNTKLTEFSCLSERNCIGLCDGENHCLDHDAGLDTSDAKNDSEQKLKLLEEKMTRDLWTCSNDSAKLENHLTLDESQEKERNKLFLIDKILQQFWKLKNGIAELLTLAKMGTFTEAYKDIYQMICRTNNFYHQIFARIKTLYGWFSSAKIIFEKYSPFFVGLAVGIILSIFKKS